jgi:Holliday junction resolvase RusA-like endonuclease
MFDITPEVKEGKIIWANKSEVFIPFNTASSKNSKINTSKGSFNSKTVQKYLKSLGIKSYSSSKKTVELYKNTELLFPVDELKALIKDKNKTTVLGFHFVRGTKHNADFNNINQIILDLMTAFDIIEDDNMDYLIPMPYKRNDKWYSYSKTEPGVYIKIIE